MAPNFLSKLVNKATPTHTRDRSDHSIASPRTSSSKPRSRAPSSATPVPPLPTARSPSPIPPPVVEKPRIPTFITTDTDGREDAGADSDSTFPSVTIVPPSPLVRNHDLSSSSSESSLASSVNRRSDRTARGNSINNSTPRPRTTSQSETKTTAEDEVATPTTPRPRTPSTAKPSTQTTPQTKSPATPAKPAPMPSKILEPEVRNKSSNRSLKKPPPVQVNHTRSATAPPPQRQDSVDSQDAGTPVYTSSTPMVESPKGMHMPDYPIPIQQQPRPQQTSPSASSPYLASPTQRDADTASLISANGTNKDKKRPWRRSTASRKPTGLASAIAASSLAIANHSLSPAQQAQLSAAANAHQPPNSASSARKLSAPGSPPYMSPSASTSSRHIKNKSVEMSPNSSKSSARVHRAGSVSNHSDNNSEYYGDDRPEYYSGLEEGSSDENGSTSSDDLMDLDLGEDDIPVTGFAVASNKRNADFHELFPTVPEGDYLIDDYGCALQREILIQGRLYISENHICFHANIFGWITDLSIPINEVTHLEKKMTAFVIPNGIQITTRQAKYTFASFLSRDTTFDVIHNIWKLERPDDASISSTGRLSYDAPGMDQVLNGVNGTGAGVAAAASIPVRKATMCTCGKEGRHLTETALDTVLPGTPDRIHNLIFASGFIKDFMVVNQKLQELQISDWTPTAPGSKLLTRNMSYIKPLNGSLGPKQTKCEIRDETVYSDPDDHITTQTTTRTPEVPSGGVFAVKTRTCITWASAVSTRILVTTEVEWTGRSFIKGIIERSAIDGQKVYHADLEKAMRAYINEHQTEFTPEGVDPAALSQAVTRDAAPVEDAPEKTPGRSEEEERKLREHERNRRGLQWAWDTFDGAYQVARRSTHGALELVKDAWEQSTSTTILYFVIVFLVFSNLWTLMRAGQRDEAVVRKGLRKEEEREKWVQGVVTALWEELSAAKVNQVPQAGMPPGMPPVVANWREEVVQLLKTLDAVEDRLRTLRSGLTSVERLDSMD